MATNPPIVIGPFSNVPAPGSGVKSDWAQQITNYVLRTVWTALPLTNGWVAVDATHIPQYRKVGDVVELRGAAKLGNVALSIGTLPVGFRPFQTDETFAVFSNAATVGLSVSATGSLTVWAPGTNAYVYLSGVKFSTVA